MFAAATKSAGADYAPLVGEYLTHLTSTAKTNTYTWNSVSFGAEDADRYIAIAFRSGGGGATGPGTITIGGVTASVFYDSVNGGNDRYIAIAYVPTGTTGTISVTVNGSTQGNGQVAVFRIIGLSGRTTPIFEHHSKDDASGTSLSTSVPYTAGGVYIGFFTSVGGAAGVTWSGMTETSDVVVDGTTPGSSALETPTSNSTTTVTATPSASRTYRSLHIVGWR
jgi:hypothetical protein